MLKDKLSRKMNQKRSSRSPLPQMIIYYFNLRFQKRKLFKIVMKVVKMKLKLIPIKILRMNNKWLDRSALKNKMTKKMATTKKERRKLKREKMGQRPHKVTAL